MRPHIQGSEIMATKKRQSLKQIRQQNENNLLDDVENVLAIHEENASVNMQIKPIECRKIHIDRNQRQLLLTPLDINQDGSLAITQDDDHYQAKYDEYQSLQPMADSIIKNGLQNPILVYIHQNDYYLKAGQRRLLASLIGGKKTILARVSNHTSDEYELEITQWVENFHREGLSTKDTLAAIREIARLWQEKYNKPITANQLGKELYCSKGQATKYHVLLDAPQDIQKAIEGGQLTSLRKAYELTRIKDTTKRQNYLQKVINGQISQDELANIASNAKKTKPKTNMQTQNRNTVNLGKTHSVEVIKDLIDSITNNPKYTDMDISDIQYDLENPKKASRAFQKLLQKMEQVTSDSTK